MLLKYNFYALVSVQNKYEIAKDMNNTSNSGP